MDYSSNNESTRGFKLIVGGIALFVGLIILIAMFPVVIVGAGQRGVVFSNVSGVQERVLGEGIHFRTPLVESVKKFDVRVQKNDVTAPAASKDLQTVTTKVVVNYRLDAGKVNVIYQNFQDEQAVIDRVIVPNTNEVVKAATAQYTAEQLLTRRAELKTKIDEGLSSRLKGYHIIVDDVSIIDLTFSKEFDAAIEAKATAEQNALKAENDLRRIEIEKQQRIAQAEGEAEAIRIQTEALSQNQNLIELEKAKRWNGVLPHTIIGGGTVPFFNVN